MKYVFIYFFCCLYLNSFAQEDVFELKKKSTSEQVLNQKPMDSLLVAHYHYKEAEKYRKTTILMDSAYYHYYKAEKIYRLLKYKYGIASALYGTAIIQKNEKDYLSSEVNSIEGITLLEELEQTFKVKEKRAFFYNNLGIVFNELEQFDKSIEYHEKSLILKRSLKKTRKIKIYNSLNNIGYVYKNIGNYDLALKYFNEILDDEKFSNENPASYALTLNNYAYTLYLSNRLNKQLPGLYFKALKMAEVNSASYVSITINRRLAEYYNNKNIKDSAKYYAYQAKNISEQYHNDDLLKSLKLLSEIEEGDIAAKHLKEYVQLSDSLQKAERKVRNKFARIRFETKEIEKENVQITRERTWLLIISVVLIIASLLLYIVITQRNRNKELKFIQQQQEANEEIYNLMLNQNENIEEARTLEKQRISEELHDGVLGRLFGARLSLDSLNMSNSIEAIKTRGQYISELKTIEEDIRKVSHELNTDFVSGSGFIDIIKTLVDTQTQVYKLAYNLTHDDDINWDGVTNKKKIHIYRIIQETLHNIYKHAKATEVNISFKLKNNVICLKIIDNGSGFDVNKAKSGIGLKNMNSRITEINGTLNLESKKDIGTTVTIEAPMA